MNDDDVFQKELGTNPPSLQGSGRKTGLLLRLIRACQPISRTEIANKLGVDKSTITDYTKPLIKQGILAEQSIEGKGHGRKPAGLSFLDRDEFFIGVNLGVRTSQVGMGTLTGYFDEEIDFLTPSDPDTAIKIAKDAVSSILEKNKGKRCRVIGISVPGLPNPSRDKLLYAPNLGWRNLDLGQIFKINEDIRVVVENDATAAAMFEVRTKIKNYEDGLTRNFVLVRSGTGIGVGLVIGSEVFRGTGATRGLAGEFGHMTIAAGGRQCICGNRGCWEKYASASSAASLYIGDRPLRPNETLPRFPDIVAKAENGELRAQRTLEKIGDYLGIGVANVIMGIGIPRVIISGRLVHGWNFIEKPLVAAINRSVVGKLEGWSVAAGDPAGSALGGAIEAAVEYHFANDIKF